MKEKYLRIIYELTVHHADTTVTQIAVRAGVTKASASAAAASLAQAGLVTRPGHRHVALTPAGRQAAVLSYGKRDILTQFFADVLGVPPGTAAEDAAAVEGRISLDTLCALCRRVKADACADCEQPCAK